MHWLFNFVYCVLIESVTCNFVQIIEFIQNKVRHTVWYSFSVMITFSGALSFKPCPAEPRFILFLKIVDPDQIASDEAIWSGSTVFHSDWKYMLINGILQVNRISCGDWERHKCLHCIHLACSYCCLGFCVWTTEKELLFRWLLDPSSESLLPESGTRLLEPRSQSRDMFLLTIKSKTGMLIGSHVSGRLIRMRN